jgi:hypothetical protein
MYQNYFPRQFGTCMRKSNGFRLIAWFIKGKMSVLKCKVSRRFVVNSYIYLRKICLKNKGMAIYFGATWSQV